MNLLLFLVLFLMVPLAHGQTLDLTPTPVPETVPYQAGSGPVIPSGNPSRSRTLLPAFGIATARPQKPVWFGIDVGAYYGQYNKLPYADIYFTPYLRLWYFTLGYDLTLRFDYFSTFVTKTWVNRDALISRISVRMHWANPKEDAPFRYVSLNISTNNNLTLGHGRFFYNYDAAAFAPTETLKTLSFSMDASYIGVNAYLANISRPDLFGAELYVRPLYAIKNPKIGYIRDLRLYAAYGADLDANQGPASGFYDFNPSASPIGLQFLEAGIEIPLAAKGQGFLLTGYADFSANFGHTAGASAAGGLIFTFAQSFPIRFEYAQGFGSWSPHYADLFFTADRSRIDFNGVVRPSKAESLPQNMGWYTIALGWEAPRRSVFINFEMAGDAALKDFQLTFQVTLGQALLKLISLDLAFSVRNLLGTKPFSPAEDMALSLTFRYHMQPNMSWELLWRLRGKAEAQFLNGAGGVPQPSAGIGLDQFLGLGFSYRY